MQVLLPITCMHPDASAAAPHSVEAGVKRRLRLRARHPLPPCRDQQLGSEATTCTLTQSLMPIAHTSSNRLQMSISFCVPVPGTRCLPPCSDQQLGSEATERLVGWAVAAAIRRAAPAGEAEDGGGGGGADAQLLCNGRLQVAVPSQPGRVGVEVGWGVGVRGWQGARTALRWGRVMADTRAHRCWLIIMIHSKACRQVQAVAVTGRGGTGAGGTRSCWPCVHITSPPPPLTHSARTHTHQPCAATDGLAPRLRPQIHPLTPSPTLNPWMHRPPTLLGR